MWLLLGGRFSPHHPDTPYLTGHSLQNHQTFEWEGHLFGQDFARHLISQSVWSKTVGGDFLYMFLTKVTLRSIGLWLWHHCALPAGEIQSPQVTLGPILLACFRNRCWKPHFGAIIRTDLYNKCWIHWIPLLASMQRGIHDVDQTSLRNIWW